MPISDCPVIGLDIEVYLNHLDPPAVLRDSVIGEWVSYVSISGRELENSSYGTVPGKISDIGWPAWTINSGCDQARVDQVKMVRREGERTV